MEPKPYQHYLAANVRALRLELGWTQAMLAERAGVHETEISRLERAARECRLGTARRVAEALGVLVATLIKPPAQD